MGHGMSINGDVYTTLQFVSVHHRYSITNDQMAHFQYNDDRMSDRKLLFKITMPLMAKQPLSTSISIISIFVAPHDVSVIQQYIITIYLPADILE